MLQLEEGHFGFHALCVKPGIEFENQKADEEVLLSIRAHPITLVLTLINSIIISILIFFSSFFLVQFLNPIQLLFVIIFSYFVAFIYLWFQIINWYFNIGLVSNKQIVDVDFSALTHRNITRTELAHVEDITIQVIGFIPSIFDYGHIFIQTAGTQINTEFLHIPNPARVQHIIEDILKEYGHNK